MLTPITPLAVLLRQKKDLRATLDEGERKLSVYPGQHTAEAAIFPSWPSNQLLASPVGQDWSGNVLHVVGQLRASASGAKQGFSPIKLSSAFAKKRCLIFGIRFITRAFYASQFLFWHVTKLFPILGKV
jgi:hypothetical protein